MITWRCPHCHECISTDLAERSSGLQCGWCGARVESSEALCVVCDAPDPLRFRDSIHVWCTSCGNTQTPWTRAIA